MTTPNFDFPSLMGPTAIQKNPVEVLNYNTGPTGAATAFFWMALPLLVFVAMRIAADAVLPLNEGASMYQQHGNGFMIEGQLRGSYEHGVEIDRQDLYQLLADKLQGGETEFAIERARITVEVLDE